MILIDSDLSDINITLPEGCIDQDGKLNQPKFEEKIRDKFNKGASGLRIMWYGHKKKQGGKKIIQLRGRSSFQSPSHQSLMMVKASIDEPGHGIITFL